jgi:hypothetical protein
MRKETIERGEITPEVENAFLRGGCLSLAIALAEETGWRVIKITDPYNVSERDGHDLPVAHMGSALHWAVWRPEDGALIDIDGAHDFDSLVRSYDDWAEGEAARAGTYRLEWAMEDFESGEAGSDVELAVARQFVEAVLKRAEE